MRKPNSFHLIFSVFILLSSFSFYTNAIASWTFENIDSVGTHSFPSIAVDSDDKLHVSYNNSNGEIKYATNKSGAWIKSPLDLVWPESEHFTDIAVDSNNKAHIVYYYGLYSYPNPSLKYATDKSGSWVKSKIDKPFKGMFNSIAIDSNKKVHISYLSRHEYNNPPYVVEYHLNYATNKSGTWVKTVIDRTVHWGNYSSIAVDSNNKIHISYDDFDDLKYATNRSGTWATTIIDSIGYVGMYSSIALDSNDNVHISYCDQSNYRLRYASNISGGWSSIDVDDAQCGFTSIAIDSGDHVHIGYYDGPFSNCIKYATNSSGFWEPTVVKPDIYLSFISGEDNVSLAVGSNDNVYIVYPNSETEQLELATYTPPPTIPNPPSSLVASPASTSSIFLSWADNSRNETGFKIERKLGDCGSVNTWQEIATVSQNTTEYADSGLSLDTTYSYQMRSYNGAGDSDYSNCSSATTYAKDVTHVTLLSPNGGETLKSGSSYSVEWEAPPNAAKFKLRYSIDNGLTWLSVHLEPYILGTIYNWIVPTLKKNKAQCLMKVMGYDSKNILVGSDRSEGVFTLEVLTITSPVLNQILSAGGSHTITWETNAIKGVPFSTRLLYTVDGGTTWKLIGTAPGNPSTFAWNPLPTVPKAKTRCRIKLLLKDSLGTTIASALSPFFTIQPQ
jgi:hypothetical protein